MAIVSSCEKRFGPAREKVRVTSQVSMIVRGRQWVNKQNTVPPWPQRVSGNAGIVDGRPCPPKSIKHTVLESYF